MRRMISIVATLLVVSITQADDNLSQVDQARTSTSKQVLISSSQLQEAQQDSVTLIPSEKALSEGSVQLVQYSRPVPAQQQSYYRPSSRQSPSVIGRLVELERRKNAWLRRTFLGRE